MADRPAASVIITNYNYERWLDQAIDSALSQTHARVEVLVVDDGSTDSSREVIAGYGGQVTVLLQPNRGQAAAINAGFAASRGDPVIFLDADDVLRPTAVARASEALHGDHVAQVHWRQIMIDEGSHPMDELFPQEMLPSGDLRRLAAEMGPGTLVTSATSGNAFPRWLLEKIMPIEPETLRMCADQYMIRLAPLFGPLTVLPEPQSLYRRHRASGYADASFDRQLELGYETIEGLIEPYARWCRKLGLPADPDGWRRSSWFHRLREIVERLDNLIDPGAPWTLIDDHRSGMTTASPRPISPFPERGGVWWGVPADDAEAIQELERQRHRGSSYLAVLWFARWWLDYFQGFAEHLRRNYRVAVDDELLVLFDLSA
jgi:glycosyltransferase involved in cell wall biosynthesis